MRRGRKYERKYQQTNKIKIDRYAAACHCFLRAVFGRRDPGGRIYQDINHCNCFLFCEK